MRKALVMVTRTNGKFWRTRAIILRSKHPVTDMALFTLVLIAWILCGVQLAKADYDKMPRQPVARRILALYDSSLEATPAETRIHRWAEMPLNHLGYVLTYRDIRKPLPTVDQARQFAGVLTWFPRIPLTRNAYLDWAIKAAQAGTKFVILGERSCQAKRPSCGHRPAAYGPFRGHHLRYGCAPQTRGVRGCIRSPHTALPRSDSGAFRG
jgi:hypothetical protein